jgi:hypothetical protein
MGCRSSYATAAEIRAWKERLACGTPALSDVAPRLGSRQQQSEVYPPKEGPAENPTDLTDGTIMVDTQTGQEGTGKDVLKPGEMTRP